MANDTQVAQGGDALIEYIARFGGFCRDCADESGVCPSSGLPCAGAEKAIRHVLTALDYGVEHGYLPVAALSAPAPAYTYASTQATCCVGCGERKHTPLRIDAMGGYVCLACIDQKLGSLLGEFGYPKAPAPAGAAGLVYTMPQIYDAFWRSGGLDDVWIPFAQMLSERFKAQPSAQAAPTEPAALTDEQIKAIFMGHGFTIKDGQADLKPYVYAAARALLAAARTPTGEQT